MGTPSQMPIIRSFARQDHREVMRCRQIMTEVAGRHHRHQPDPLNLLRSSPPLRCDTLSSETRNRSPIRSSALSSTRSAASDGILSADVGTSPAHRCSEEWEINCCSRRRRPAPRTSVRRLRTPDGPRLTGADRFEDGADVIKRTPSSPTQTSEAKRISPAPPPRACRARRNPPSPRELAQDGLVERRVGEGGHASPSLRLRMPRRRRRRQVANAPPNTNIPTGPRTRPWWRLATATHDSSRTSPTARWSTPGRPTTAGEHRLFGCASCESEGHAVPVRLAIRRRRGRRTWIASVTAESEFCGSRLSPQ